MTPSPIIPPTAVKPSPNIYTALLIIGIVALGVALGVVLHILLGSPANGGYGLDFGQLFSGVEPPK